MLETGDWSSWRGFPLSEKPPSENPPSGARTALAPAKSDRDHGRVALVVSLRARREGGATDPRRILRQGGRPCAPRRLGRRAVPVAVGLATLGLATLGLPLRAGAEEDLAAAPRRVTVGDTASALPGLARVGVPGARASVLSLAVTGGYGLTEAQAEQSGANHRALGVVAVAVAPVDWLALDLRLDGRYDVHPADARGDDAGGVGEPRLGARVGQRWQALGLGAELVAWLPGSDAPSVDFGATTLDARGLVAATPGEGRTTVAGLLGFRLDRSAETEPDPERLRVGDRVSLGVSEFDALLLGLGVSQRVGALELLGEVSADWLLGSDSPGLGRSPLRLTAGARHPILPLLSLEVLAEVVPTGRPSVAPDAPLAPIEPRFLLSVGLRARPMPVPDAPPSAAPPPPAAPPAPPAPPTPPAPPAPPEPVVCTVTGTVVDEGGAPIVDAEVKAQVGEAETTGRTDAAGHFEIRGEACGAGTLTVSAVDFDPASRDVEVTEAAGTPVEILLRPAVPAGELRGLVRALDGTPVAARVRVVGTAQTATTAADGSFSLQVPPGSYTVEVESEGFTQQRRTVRIENRGVTILNADLRPRP